MFANYFSPVTRVLFQKKNALVLLITFLLAGYSLKVQAQQPIEKKTILPVRSAVVNFQQLAEAEALLPKVPGATMGVVPNEADEEGYEEPYHPLSPAPPAQNTVNRISVVSPSPVLNFEGAPDEAKGGGTSGTYNIPPDTYGAVGLDKVFVNLNNNYRILDKTTGTQLSLVSMTAFWAPLGAPDATGVFDPRIVYDPYNNRWLVVVVSNGSSGASRMLLAISQTHDPQGNYNLYAFDPDAAGATLWMDFPMLGFNKNWVVVSGNMFTIAGAFSQSRIFAIDYPSLRGGIATATLFSGLTAFCIHPAETFSSTEETMYLPNHFSSGGATYALNTITGTPALPVYTSDPSGFRIRPGGGWVEPGGNIGPQTCVTGVAPVFTCPGALTGVDVGDANLRGNVVFRGGAIWYAQTVGLPAGGPITHTAVQWTKLNPSGTFNDGGRIEDPAATSASGSWYTYPTIAVNASNDVTVGFSKLDGTSYPGSAYAFRFATDAAGTMQDPVVYKAGIDYYEKDFGGGRNRWGDYSHTMVDPLNDASFWTLQEYARLRATPNVDGYSKWGTWWAKVDPSPCLSNVASGNWNTAATWGCGSVPTATKHVSIISGQNVTLDIDPLAASITVNGGGTLTVNAARTLSCKLIVYGTLNITGGKLTLGTNDVFLAGGATLTGASSTSYFVTNSTGVVSKIIAGGGSFEFPVSPNTSSYNALTIATSGGNPAEVFNVRVSTGLTPTSTNNAACVQRTWNINEMTSGGNNATLTFKWAAAEHGGSFTPSSAFAYRHNGSTYVLASSMTVPVLASGIYSSSTTSLITSFSPWIVSNSGTLPIIMNYFTGSKLATNKNQLNWKATCSGANANFELQRSSDSRNFTALTIIDADYARCLQPFDFTDNDPFAGKNFYRVKVKDENGKITYSNTILLLNSNFGFEITSIQPNPTGNIAILNVSVANRQLLTFYVTDNKGSRVMQKQLQTVTGVNQEELNLSNLPAGTYLLTLVSQQNEQHTIRFVKQ